MTLGEVDDGEAKVRCLGRDDAARSNVVRDSGREDSESAAGLEHVLLEVELPDHEEHEGDVEEEEQRGGGQVRSERGEAVIVDHKQTKG